MGIKKTIIRKIEKINHKFSKKLIIKNKRIIVTGSNSGIGLELTKKLVSTNSIISTVNKKKNEVDKIKNENLKILEEDFQNENLTENFCFEVKEFKPNIIINCAAIFGPEEQSLENLHISEFKKILNINFFSPLKLVQLSLNGKQLEQIVNISSEMGSITLNNMGGYYYYRLSKTLLNSFSKNLSNDIKSKNINIFCVHPGSVKTKMNSAGVISPDQSAQKIINIINENDRNLSGKFIDINKKILEW